MRHIKLTFLAFAVIFATACKNDTKTSTDTNNTETLPPPPPPPVNVDGQIGKSVTVNLSAKSGSNVEGTIKFSETNGMVTMVGTITGLEEGEHAIHLHATADCSSDDGKSSGGHWNPTGQPHGAWGDATGYHKGDIGNFKTQANGRATVTKTTDEWCIGCGDETKDILGKAVIVHLGVDDLKSQPSGAAGARVGCAGIIEAK